MIFKLFHSISMSHVTEGLPLLLVPRNRPTILHNTVQCCKMIRNCKKKNVFLVMQHGFKDPYNSKNILACSLLYIFSYSFLLPSSTYCFAFLSLLSFYFSTLISFLSLLLFSCFPITVPQSLLHSSLWQADDHFNFYFSRPKHK